ncbi:MAG: twin-arginine translocase TatA/TatE family subunit [Planctomycetes bacterium]|nr:twin-arginine translocase TatA/TatE family subunit [Planctomycetota bacterium]
MFGLGGLELLIVGVVGLLLFGGNLPKVAAEAARWFVGLKRSLNDIRRETGIEREIENAKREIERSVEQSHKVREVQQKLTDTIARPFREAAQETRSALDAPLTPPPPAPEPRVTPDPPAIQPMRPPPRTDEPPPPQPN